MDYNERAEAIRSEIKAIADELAADPQMPLERVNGLEAEIATKSAAIDALEAEKRDEDRDRKVAELEDRLKSFTRKNASEKASAILAGASGAASGMKSVGRYNSENWLSALVNRRLGDADAAEFVKGVLGTTTATGLAIVPNNFLDRLVEQVALANPYRRMFNVVNVQNGAGVDIPYEITAVTAAILQGAYGSNKDVRDWQFAKATATLYEIAQIADIGNQLLRQSNGAAEAAARRRLGGSIGMAEAQFINNGSGSSQPLGFFQAFLAYGDPAGFKTTLSSEPRAATFARAFAALESRGFNTDRLAIVCNPTDFWEMASEGLGTSYAGGWSIDPAAGPAGSPPIQRIWGVPIYRDANWPSAQAGTALVIDTSEVEIFVQEGMQIDVSSEGGNRFDQNVTGFRAEELFGFNAEPYVRSGRVQKVIGI
jgi:HK97 family phage major capsid protein